MAKRAGRVTAGIVLVVVGLALYLLRHLPGFGEAAWFLVLGVAFLGLYLDRRELGFLVPGCILSGLGVGRLLSEGRWWGSGAVLGLGLGFIAITVIDRVYRGRFRWWPLVPGVILVLLALPNADEVFDVVAEHWPLVIVAVGIAVLLGGVRGRRS